jgi:predicted dehydrogenase
MSTNRRSFLKTTASGAMAGALSIPAIHAEKAPAKYRTALIGSGWWGMNILGEAMRAGRSNVVGLCDVDTRQLHPAAAKVTQMSGDQPKLYRDYRELLEREKPEVVIVGTPDHWHPLQTIAAVEAGAHVYVEKPVGHTIEEGRAMVNAARRSGKMVQVGTHRRVSPHNVSGMEFLKSGKAGKIGMVRCFVHYGGGVEKPANNQEVPKEVDWDMWCGPAPYRHYCENFPNKWGNALHPKGFRQYLDYANGTLGDWGIHWLDQVLWWTDELAPKTIYSTGDRNIAGDAVYTAKHQTSDAPDHQLAVYDFEDFSMTWEHRKFAGNETDRGENVGCYFYGTEGIFHQGWRGGWTFYPSKKGQKPIHQGATLHEPDSQNIRELWADFLASIENKKRLPVCDIEIGHRSTNMSLLGMISMKLGRSIEWDHTREKIVGDPEANNHLHRAYRGEWEYPKA